VRHKNPTPLQDGIVEKLANTEREMGMVFVAQDPPRPLKNSELLFNKHPDRQSSLDSAHTWTSVALSGLMRLTTSQKPPAEQVPIIFLTVRCIRQAASDEDIKKAHGTHSIHSITMSRVNSTSVGLDGTCFAHSCISFHVGVWKSQDARISQRVPPYLVVKT
jgi:hypothetical protein